MELMNNIRRDSLKISFYFHPSQWHYIISLDSVNKFIYLGPLSIELIKVLSVNEEQKRANEIEILFKDEQTRRKQK